MRSSMHGSGWGSARWRRRQIKASKRDWQHRLCVWRSRCRSCQRAAGSTTCVWGSRSRCGWWVVVFSGSTASMPRL
jgi:hypothetical protein